MSRQEIASEYNTRRARAWACGSVEGRNRWVTWFERQVVVFLLIIGIRRNHPRVVIVATFNLGLWSNGGTTCRPWWERRKERLVDGSNSRSRTPHNDIPGVRRNIVACFKDEAHCINTKLGMSCGFLHLRFKIV